jgi:hypothetical protein
MEFLKFVDSAKEVLPSEFYRSTVAIDNGVDASWWPDVEPQCFLVFEEHKGSIAGLTWLLFKWFTEDSP